MPKHSFFVDDVGDFDKELWLYGEPLSVHALNNVLELAEAGLPHGMLDFDNSRDEWVFSSSAGLADSEKSRVRAAAKKIGIGEVSDFVVASLPTMASHSPTLVLNLPTNLDLVTHRQMHRAPRALSELLHQDEDDWRSFLSRRGKREIVVSERSPDPKFSCLYDIDHCGDSRLSELLTLYDRVDIIPGKIGSDWILKHQVSIADLRELVQLKRIRIILPSSLTHYSPDLIEAVREIDRSSLVLSRALAIKTIVEGQAKEPLLYAPLNSHERAMLLSALYSFNSDEKYRRIIKSYGNILLGQHHLFMMRGALASLGAGVGAFLGDALFHLTSKDARLEIMTCGAGIEWALGLGSSYIPRNFGGYDETHNSQIIASYLGRTDLRGSDPVANRMHMVADGLLAVSGVPPIEIARNFRSFAAARFRGLAQEMMRASSDASELQDCIGAINSDVRAFERRADRIASWKLHVVGAAVVGSAFDHFGGFVASTGAAWIYEVFEDKVPRPFRDEARDLAQMLIGLATGSSLDTIIVSRARKTLLS